MTRAGVYLYGYYGQGNLGDDLLMTSAVSMIRGIAPDAPILLHCHDALRVPDLADQNVKPICASAVLADVTRNKLTRFASYVKLLNAHFPQCRTFVFGGGTVLQEGTSPMGLIVILATLMLARHHGLAVVAIGSGIGAARTYLGRFLLRRILKRIDVLCLRDAASIAAAHALVPGKPVRAVADLVYALPTPQALDKPLMKHVVFSVQPAVSTRKDTIGSGVRAALHDAISKCLARGWQCTLLAFETKAGDASGLDDRAAWLEIAGDLLACYPAQLKLLPSVESGNSASNLADVMACMGRAHVHLGQRYHGHVLASVAGVPFAGLAHDRKIMEVCRSFAMPFTDVENITQEAAFTLLDAAANLHINTAALNELRTAALLNTEALREVLA